MRILITKISAIMPWRAGFAPNDGNKSSGRVVVLLLLIALGLPGCALPGYYAQAARGQFSLLWRSEPIDSVVSDPSVSASRRRQLILASRIRRFAVEQLALPDNASYTRFVDVQQPYVLWNVFTAPIFSTEPVTWCFPIAGCVAYRGYFSRQAAFRFAEQMRQKGYDVSVGGVKTYSTLGWLPDPVPNTILDLAEEDLAGLLFHELAHQLIYVTDDTTFNESFATLVEHEGVRRWLAQSDRQVDFDAFEDRSHRRDEVIKLVLNHQAQLAALYAQDLMPSLMTQRKLQQLAALQQSYLDLRSRGGGGPGWDAWFSQPLNNAHLAAIGAYYDLVPDFRRLFNAVDQDFEAFYKAVGRIADGPKQGYRTALAAIP